MLQAVKLLCVAVAFVLAGSAQRAQAAGQDADKPSASVPGTSEGLLFTTETASSDGSVSIGSTTIAYTAVAGTLVVHPAGWDDAAWRAKSSAELADKSHSTAEAAMSFVAYSKKTTRPEERPIVFLYNGGPGASTLWLHMGAFGPRRVVTADHSHTAAAPYNLVNNQYSLLDSADLVFVDAPGTGFGRIAGKDKEKSFWGTDADAHAFAQFIKTFLSRYGRWNSPKYLLGESYGTLRSAVLINKLQADHIEFNGVLLLSQVLSFALHGDFAPANPGIDAAYVLPIPSYAAAAWYHHRIPGERPADLPVFLKEVEHFVDTEYAAALQMGTDLDPERKRAVAEKLAGYIGLPAAYILESDLRVTGAQFAKMLLDDRGETVGELDARFTGPSLDRLSKEAEYDPQMGATIPAYLTAFNDYTRKTLKFGDGRDFKAIIDVDAYWDFQHAPGGGPPIPGSAINVLPDLAVAMKTNPNLKIATFSGYYDLETPYYEAAFEMRHLPIPPSLQRNIEYHRYESGHVIYANEPSLERLHEDICGFIRRTGTNR